LEIAVPAEDVVGAPAPAVPPVRLLDLTPSPRVAVSEPIDEPRRVIAVADFESACEGLVKNMKDAWD